MASLTSIMTAAALLSFPTHAANFQAGVGGEVRTGAFVGARLRIPLGADTGGKPQTALMVAMTQTHRQRIGGTVTRIGEGAALDFAGSKPVLRVAGIPADVALGLRRQGRIGDGNRLGMSTGVWIGIGAAVALAGVLVITQLTCVGKDKDYCGSD